MAPNTTRVPVLNCTIFYWSRRQLNYQLSLFLQSQLQLQLRAAIATDYNNRLQPSTFPAISIPDTCALHALVEVFGSANRMDSFPSISTGMAKNGAPAHQDSTSWRMFTTGLHTTLHHATQQHNNSQTASTNHTTTRTGNTELATQPKPFSITRQLQQQDYKTR